MTISLFAQNARSTELTDKDVQSFAKYCFTGTNAIEKYAMLCRSIGILTVERN